MDESDEKVTLTQRRSGRSSSLSGADKLEKSKLQSYDDFDSDSGAAKRIIIWIIIAIAVGAAAYLGYTQYMERNASDDTTEETAPIPTPDPKDDIVSTTVLGDELAINPPAASSFSTKTQTVGTASEDLFDINNLFVQPYTTFIRVELAVATDGESIFPETYAIYDAETMQISLTISNIEQNFGGLETGDTVSVNNSVLNAVSLSVPQDSVEEYILSLSASTSFFLHSIEDEIGNILVLDIMEVEVPEEVMETPTVTAPVTTVSTTPKVTQPEDDSTSTGDSGVFSLSPKSISTGNTANDLFIDNYPFQEYAGYFNFTVNYSGSANDPNVIAAYEGDVLVLTVKNIKQDKTHKTTGARILAEYNIKSVEKINITANSNNQTVYKFTLVGAGKRDFKIALDKEVNTVNLQIKR